MENRPPNFDLSGHAALVTGSTRGIGAAMADGLTEAGATVLLHGTRATSPQNPAVLLQDLLQPDGPSLLLQAAFAIRPSLNLLVCNAGSFFDVPFLQMDRARYEKTMRLNVESVFFLVQEFARRISEQKREGAVVIVSSTNGFQSEEDSVAYDTSKGALVMLTRSLALALGPMKIRVNGIAPGLIRTPLTQGWMDREPDRVRHVEQKIILGRTGKAEDCAGACVFLCSAAAAYITGEILTVDGGLTTTQIGRFSK
jgi:NAD(P)-dependent dehydrogenase (short-subunit alcohol dehydrogenase family)